MYYYIDAHTVSQYDNEVLKRYVGNRLVKVIANPTNTDLEEFGYKTMVEETPLVERDNHYIETYYEDGEVITKKYRYIEMVDDPVAGA